jgi:UDP-glucose 6-dehydrogenase
MKKRFIGFIGQGWIGKHYADNFEERGYDVIRYSREEPHINNGDKIKECDIVFIAVPTPTTPDGFDDSILRQAIKKVGKNKIAVIKSTLLPGTTEKIQKENPDIFVFHSPEFLTEVTAAYDAANPNRNIIGMPVDNDEYREKAKLILSILPKAPFELISSAREAEFIKYGGNNWFYFKVIFINMLYDLAMENNCQWEVIRNGLAGDPRIGSSHLNPVHKSGTSGGEAKKKLPFYELHLEPVHKSGRGAGGHCFIKDFAAFTEIYEKLVGDELGTKLLEAMRDKNIDLLLKSTKDIDLLAGVYGEEIIKKQQQEDV